MALRKKINPFLKSNNDTGFSTSPSNVGGRFINKNGTFNIKKTGAPFWERYSIFHSMLNLPSWKFIGVIVFFFLASNLFFALIYILLGKGQFTGMVAATEWETYKEIYFFSAQTFTTVGYGRVNPVGVAANLIASIEAMAGLLTFAIATGLIYGRFSKPKAFLVFSDHALTSPYQGGIALMFRFASYKDNHTLTDVEVKVNVGFQILENEKNIYKFYSLDLERSQVDSLPMSWTIVHPIDEKSPLRDFNFEDMKAADLEVFVFVKGFDDVYSNIVLQRTSYTYEEIKLNAKFILMSKESDDDNTTILELEKLNVWREV